MGFVPYWCRKCTYKSTFLSSQTYPIQKSLEQHINQTAPVFHIYRYIYFLNNCIIFSAHCPNSKSYNIINIIDAEYSIVKVLLFVPEKLLTKSEIEKTI